jgi:hypothetical protein
MGLGTVAIRMKAAHAHRACAHRVVVSHVERDHRLALGHGHCPYDFTRAHFRFPSYATWAGHLARIFVFLSVLRIALGGVRPGARDRCLRGGRAARLGHSHVHRALVSIVDFDHRRGRLLSHRVLLHRREPRISATKGSTESRGRRIGPAEPLRASPGSGRTRTARRHLAQPSRTRRSIAGDDEFTRTRSFG